MRTETQQILLSWLITIFCKIEVTVLLIRPHLSIVQILHLSHIRADANDPA